MHSTKVSSKHLIIQTQFKLIVKNEFVETNGNTLVVSGFGARTLKVAQHPSNFSKRNTVEVIVSSGSLDIGSASGVFPDPQVYKDTGLVLKNVAEF